MVSDRDVATALRDLIDADPEHGMVLLTADRRVLYSNVAARGYLRHGRPRSEDALLPESLDRVLHDFVVRARKQRGHATAELNDPSEQHRKDRITL